MTFSDLLPPTPMSGLGHKQKMSVMYAVYNDSQAFYFDDDNIT